MISRARAFMYSKHFSTSRKLCRALFTRLPYFVAYPDPLIAPYLLFTHQFMTLNPLFETHGAAKEET